MTIPKAVSPGTLTPGLYLSINLLAGSAGPSVGLLRTLLLCPKAPDGDLTPDTEIRNGGGADSAAIAFGVGSPGHLAAKQLYAMYPTAVVDFGAPVAGTGTATLNVTLSGAPTANVAVGVRVAGREWEVGWLVGMSADDVKALVVTSVLQRTTDLPATASSGGTGIVTFSGKATGKISNDIQVKVWLKSPQTGTEAITPHILTPLAGGATDPDYTNILAAAQGVEYHVILDCLSNADAELTSASSNAERTLTDIELYNHGLDAKLQTLVYASTKTLAGAEAAALARNVGFAEHVHIINGQSLPCEFAAAEAGDRLQQTALDPAVNRIGNQIGTSLYGSENPIADNPTVPMKEAGIGSGVTMLAYDASGNIYVVRPITTYSQNTSGGPDRRLLDVQNVDATYIIARDMRSALPAEFPNAKIIKDQAPGVQEIPKGVTEERDVRAFVTSRLRSWVKDGVVLGSALEAAIASGELIVAVDDQDASQVNIVLPISIVPPLAKFGVVVNRNPV